MGEASAYEESEDFHIKDFVWVYCKAEDKGSGAYYLTANGKIIPLTYANSTTDKKQNFVLTAENIYEIGPFKLEFDSDKYEDGKIDVEFALYDYCDNKCPDTKSYSFIKDTQIEQPYVYLYNEFPNPTTWFYSVITFYANYFEDTNRGLGKYRGEDCGINGARPYYDEEDFNSYYKKIYIKGMGNDAWLSNSTELTGKDNVKVYYTVNGTEYKAEYSEEDSDYYASCFIMDKFSENEDTYVRAVIQDSVGNTKEISNYIPTGKISVNYGTDSYYLYPNATKSTINNADSVDYMYFYEFEWTDEIEDSYNNDSYIKSKVNTVKSLVTTYSDEYWVNYIDAAAWEENAAETIRTLCGVKKNKKYLVDFYSALNLSGGSKFGYGHSSYNCVVTSISFPSTAQGNNVNPTSLDLSDLYTSNLKTLTCYAVPRYKYTDTNTHYIYGKPVKNSVALSSNSTSTDYTVDFDLGNVVSSGKNTGTSEITISNVSIKDSNNNDCTSDFDINYTYTRDSTTYNYDENTIVFESLRAATELSAGIYAVKKSDSSVVVTKSEDFTAPAIDNNPPRRNESTNSYPYHTYNIYDYDKTGKNLYIDLQWFRRAPDDRTNYSKINYLFEDRDTTGWALRTASGSYDFDYYWLSYDSTTMSSELPNLKYESDGTENFSYLRKGTSKFDWIYPLATTRNTGYKMWLPMYDMEDGHYVLAIKLEDESGNFFLNAITYQDVETYKNLPVLTLSGTTLDISLDFGDQRKPSERNYWGSYRNTIVAGIQYFDSEWKEVNNNFYLTPDNSMYPYSATGSISVEAASGHFIRCAIQGYYCYSNYKDQELDGRLTNIGGFDSQKAAIDVFNGDINSYPVYKYIGESTGSYHNLLDANGGITVFCDAPAFVHTLYSIREEGYGNDINEWERRARELNPKQISSSSNYNVPISSLPEDAKSYVVVAHFADGTSAISNVHKK